VFGDHQVASAAEQRVAWETLKAREQGREPGGVDGALDGLATALPALARAAKLGRRAAGVGFDWPDASGVLEKLGEEIAELESARTGDNGGVTEEVGDLLFTAANLARHLDVDAEDALRRANAKFERRFRHVERQVRESGRPWRDFSPAELDGLWERAKLECEP
jgi:ATP diphosphatase